MNDQGGSQMWISCKRQLYDADLVLKHKCHEPLLTILSIDWWQHQQPETTSRLINNCQYVLTVMLWEVCVQYVLHTQHSCTFCYFASSPPGRFATTLDDSLPGRLATWMVRCLDISPPGWFPPLDILIPGRFATSLDVSSVCDTVRSLASLSSGVETSREAAKRPGIETSRWRNVQVAKFPGSEASRQRIT